MRRKPASISRLPNAQDKQAKASCCLKLRWSSLMLIGVIGFVILTNTQFYIPLPQTQVATAASNPQSIRDLSGNEEEKQQAVSLPDNDSVVRQQATAQQLAMVQPSGALKSLQEKIAIPHQVSMRPESDDEESSPMVKPKKWVVRSGDTLSGILDHFNTHSALSDILNAPGHKPFLKLIPGKTMKLFIQDNHLLAMQYHKSPTTYLSLSRQGKEAFTFESHQLETEVRQAYAYGEVTSSFYAAALEAGLSDRVIVNMANILAWDIDFILSIRSQDYFSVIYEEKYLNGEKIGDGDILAVDFHNNGAMYRAIRYTPSNGRTDYYAPNGRILRKAFLRSPVEFTRISSRFSLARLHPVHKTVRPHRGVDYGAPTGTPVHSSGDGRISFRGKKSGYGNVVIISHAGIYSTLYAHLSRFASNQKVGSLVKQKQIIGYVGMTGVATGPHLHYEFRVNGAHKDPLKVKLPEAQPLASREMPHFKKMTTAIQAQLDVLSKTIVARIKDA